jgi:hypothetical protein
MEEIPIYIDLTKELGVPGELGGETVEEGGFFAAAHDQPIGVPVRRILSQFQPEEVSGTERETSKLYNLYRRFELWLIPHGVAILRRSGHAEPVAVGVEVKYKNDDRTCSIRSLIPAPRFLEHGHVRGSLNLSGEIDSADAQDAGLPIKECLGLKFCFGGKAELAVHFDATVVTPYLSAVGINSSRCEWIFDKHTEPLFGKDIQTWAIVALPKRQTELRYDIRFSFTARTFLISRNYASDWVERVCRLER